MEYEEELINDPGNHTILKETAKRKSIDLNKLCSETGIQSQRLIKKIEDLEKNGLIKLVKDKEPVEATLNREKLKNTQNQIMQFQQDKKQIIKRNIAEDKKKLKEVKNQLIAGNGQKPERINKTVKNQIMMLENCIDMISKAETSQERFEAHAASQRTLKRTGDTMKFHNLNLWRKLKTSNKINSILDQEPTESEQRTFFGNRWIAENS